MWEYINNIIEFCKEYPGWALAFFLCGYLIGDTYFDQKQYDKALPLYESALREDEKERPEITRRIASRYLDIGQCYRELKQYDDAIYHLKIAGQKYRDIEGKNGEMVEYTLSWLANTYDKAGNRRMGKAIWNEHDRVERYRRSQGE